MKKDIYIYQTVGQGLYTIYKNGRYFSTVCIVTQPMGTESIISTMVDNLNNKSDSKQSKITLAMYVVALFSIIGVVSTLYYFFEVLLPTLV